MKINNQQDDMGVCGEASRLLNPCVHGDRPATRSPTELLSARELEIYRLLGAGHGTRGIAAKLRIAASTVACHRAGIKRKLALRSAMELVANAGRFVAAASSPPS